MTDEIPMIETGNAAAAPRTRRKLPARIALIGAGLLGLGVAGGAAAVHMNGPSIEMAPASPVAIASLKDDGSIVTVRGRVAERYGPMFVLADGGGRTLVDAGRQADGTAPVGLGSTVTVQGHFRSGIVRASFLVTADGKVTALHPFGPRHGPGGPRHHRGPERGPDDGPDGGPDGDDAPPPPDAATVPAAQGPASIPAPATTQR